ncbi:MAG TPA: hypothetical protein VNO14_06800 [Blastocatellia bacterium]|nr:hypothetical protein [Blastocatellia bacterium]
MNKDKVSKEVLIEKLQGTERRINLLARKSSRALAAVSYRLEDALLTARRGMKRGYYAAEDLADEAIHTMKRYPLRSVGLAFGAGLALGWFTSRNGKKP